MTDLSYFDAIILGIVEGLTEFLPVSSTGHLTIAEKALGLPVDAPEVTAYTAIIQLGAIGATLLYFAKEIWRLLIAWVGGLRSSAARGDEYRLAWAVIIGSIPVAVAALAFKDLITGGLRSLWVVAFALIAWSVVIVVAERRHEVVARQGTLRTDKDITIRDGIIIGLVQCFSLVPGVSRSGATISAGLLLGIDRVNATILSFFMAIPALTAAGLYEAATVDLSNLGVGPMAVGVVVSFVVAYAAIAWLLKFVASNTLMPFVYYRVALGVVLVGLLAGGVITAT